MEYEETTTKEAYAPSVEEGEPLPEDTASRESSEANGKEEGAFEATDGKSADNEVIDGDLVKNDDSPAAKSAFYSSAKVFGVSEEQMENEFKSFKAGKLFEKISLSLADPYMTAAEFNNKLLAAASMGFDSVSVLPNRLGAAIKTVGDKLRVYVCASYPYAADDVKTKLFVLKRMAKTAVVGVELPLASTDLYDKKLRALVSEYKKYRKARGKKELVLVVDVARISPAEMGEIASLCKGAGITTVKTFCAAGESGADEYVINNLKSCLGDGIRLIASSYSREGKDVVGIFSCGADKFSSPNAIEVAKGIKDSLS